jgi:transposase
VTYQSGKASQSRGINRTGDPHLRGMLYMATWSAIRFNKPCQEFYQRLKTAGKPGKVALIAVANKLIRQAFDDVKYGEDFNPDYQPILRSFT